MGQIGTEASTNLDDTHGTSHSPGTDTPSTYARRAPYALAVAVISILVVSLATIALWQEKQRYRERATVATQNISRLLEQHVSDVIDKIDVVLQSAVFDYRQYPPDARLDLSKVNSRLAQQQSLLPEVIALRILDKDGIVRFGNGLPADNAIDVSDREYFARGRDDRTGGLVVSGPLFGRITQQWVIVLSRRLTAADGSFAGVVCASLTTSHFEKILAAVALGPLGAATIRTTDLALVHRHPETKSAVGSKDVSKQLREHLQASPLEGEYIAVTALDGIERSNAYRKLERFPFYVIVGLATDDYLGAWKNSVLMYSGLAGLLIAIVVLAALLVYRAVRRKADEIARRKQTERELEAYRDHLEATVVKRTDEVRRLAGEATYAEERERQAVARDLHDDLGQVLHVARLRVDLLGKEALSANGQSLVEDAAALIADASRQVRSLTSHLSPPILATLGLSAALRWLCDELQQTYTLPVVYRGDVADPDTGLSPAQSAILFRAARELLINVAKHSESDSASLGLRLADSTLTMVVEDSGNGVPVRAEVLAATKGFGLTNVRERITFLGGKMNIETPSGGGLRVVLQMPLEAQTGAPRVPA